MIPGLELYSPCHLDAPRGSHSDGDNMQTAMYMQAIHWVNYGAWIPGECPQLHQSPSPFTRSFLISLFPNVLAHFAEDSCDVIKRKLDLPSKDLSSDPSLATCYLG